MRIFYLNQLPAVLLSVTLLGCNPDEIREIPGGSGPQAATGGVPVRGETPAGSPETFPSPQKGSVGLVDPDAPSGGAPRNPAGAAHSAQVSTSGRLTTIETKPPNQGRTGASQSCGARHVDVGTATIPTHSGNSMAESRTASPPMPESHATGFSDPGSALSSSRSVPRATGGSSRGAQSPLASGPVTLPPGLPNHGDTGSLAGGGAARRGSSGIAPRSDVVAAVASTASGPSSAAGEVAAVGGVTVSVPPLQPRPPTVLVATPPAASRSPLMSGPVIPALRSGVAASSGRPENGPVGGPGSGAAPAAPTASSSAQPVRAAGSTDPARGANPVTQQRQADPVQGTHHGQSQGSPSAAAVGISPLPPAVTFDAHPSSPIAAGGPAAAIIGSVTDGGQSLPGGPSPPVVPLGAPHVAGPVAVPPVDAGPARRFAELAVTRRPSLMTQHLIPRNIYPDPVFQLLTESTPLQPRYSHFVSTVSGRQRMYDVHTGPTVQALVNEQLVYESILGRGLRDLVGEAHAVARVGDPTAILVAVDRLGRNSFVDCYIDRGRPTGFSFLRVRITESRLAELAAAAIAGLRDIHSTGLVHGRIESRTIILVEEEGDANNRRLVAFTDLRYASFFIDPVTGDHIPNTPVPLPTPLDDSMSLFAIEGAPPSRRDDMYCLAATLFAVFKESFDIDYDSTPPADLVAALRALRTRMALSSVFNEFYAAMVNLQFAERPNYEAWITRFTEVSQEPPPVPVRDGAAIAAMVGVDVAKGRAFDAEKARLEAAWIALRAESPGQCPPPSLTLAGDSMTSRVVRLNPRNPMFHGADANIFISTDPAGELAIRVAQNERQFPGETIREHAFKAVAGAGGGAWAAMHPIVSPGPGLDAKCAMTITVSDYAGRNTVSKFGPPDSTHRGGDPLLPVTPRQVAAIAARLIEMLREVHQAGIVHGDIHGGNIVMSDVDAPTLKLIDFGRAETFVDIPTGLHILPIPLLIAMSMRNPALLAPFELEGDIPTRRDDMYRLSEILCVLLDPTSRPRFPGGDVPSTGTWLETSRLKRAWRISSAFNPAFNEFKDEMTNLAFNERPIYEAWIDRFRQIAAAQPATP